MDTKNNNDTNQKRYFVDTIAKFCNRCGAPYSLNDFNIIKSTKTSTIIHFTCSKCKAEHIANISKRGDLQRVPMLTDLHSFNEVSKFVKMKRIPLNEVLDLYNSFKETKDKSL